jgi:hypothetical protein
VGAGKTSTEERIWQLARMLDASAGERDAAFPKLCKALAGAGRTFGPLFKSDREREIDAIEDALRASGMSLVGLLELMQDGAGLYSEAQMREWGERCRKEGEETGTLRAPRGGFFGSGLSGLSNGGGGSLLDPDWRAKVAWLQARLAGGLRLNAKSQGFVADMARRGVDPFFEPTERQVEYVHSLYFGAGGT